MLDQYIAEHQKAGFYWGSYMRERSPELFAGIQFDMLSGKCLNPQIKPTSVVNSAAKTEWLRALRRFKHGMKIRAKIGVLDSLCQQVASERSRDRNTWAMPDWTHSDWSDLLHTSIKNNDYPATLLKGFIMSAPSSYWRSEPPTVAGTLAAVDDVCNELSVEMRRRFGVFDA